MDNDAIEEAAARWFVRRGSDQWTPADQQTFDVWLACSPLHRIAYLRVGVAWQRAERMRALGAGVPVGVIPVRGSWGDARFSVNGSTKNDVEAAPGERADGVPDRKARRGPLWAVAAAIVVIVLCSALYLYVADPMAGDRFSTSVGGTESVRLADGSRVTLNTDTTIYVVLGDKERHVNLIKGEAFFEVAKDAAHPFIVYAADKRVRAVGTAFSVRRNSDDVEVVVTEGKVQLATAPSLLSTLEQKGHIAGTSASASDGGVPPPTLVRAGSIARTANTEVLVQEQGTSEAEEALSWRAGYLVFHDTRLAQAAAEFNRYNSRKIVIEDPAIGAIRIGGNFRANNIDAFLALIQIGFPIRVEENGEARVVLTAR